MLATAKNKKLAKREKNLVLKDIHLDWVTSLSYRTVLPWLFPKSFEAFLFLPSMAKAHPCFVN